MSAHGRTVIDAEGLILGRMASVVAKRLLEGERIEIVNAEGAVVSGKRKQVIKERKEFLNVGGPKAGPIHYRKPNAIVRRTVRGMLPRRKPGGGTPIAGSGSTSACPGSWTGSRRRASRTPTWTGSGEGTSQWAR